MNFDETLIPFEYLDHRSYDFKGKKTVLAKTDRSGWSKRQATLILYIFADGIPRINPNIIFHGTTTKSGGKLEVLEGDKYAKGVSVHFNKSAYNNEGLIERWLNEKLIPLIRPINQPHQPFLLSFDCAAFHKTPPLLRKMKDNDITPALVPPSCTGILQPLDTHINKPFKEYLQEATKEYMDHQEDETGIEAEKWSVSNKRIMVTHVVDVA
jgi:DDE superfamily endonuclease